MVLIESGRKSSRSVAARPSSRILGGLWQRCVSFVRELLDVLETAGDRERANALRDALERRRRG